MKANIIEKAKRIVENRRYDAVNQAQNNKIKALKNDEFKSVYYQYVDSMMNDARNGLDSTQETQNLEKKCKLWLRLVLDM